MFTASLHRCGSSVAWSRATPTSLGGCLSVSPRCSRTPSHGKRAASEPVSSCRPRRKRHRAELSARAQLSIWAALSRNCAGRVRFQGACEPRRTPVLLWIPPSERGAWAAGLQPGERGDVPRESCGSEPSCARASHPRAAAAPCVVEDRLSAGSPHMVNAPISLAVTAWSRLLSSRASGPSSRVRRSRCSGGVRRPQRT